MDGFEPPRVAGKLAEVRAEQLLTDKGMTILARNYRIQGAEIDLIALEGRRVVFVEVKERRGSIAGRCYVTPAQQKRISKAALMYLAKNALMDRPVRFDVIEIQNNEAAHIENAFQYQGRAF